MDDLIEALKIFQKYVPENQHWPTHCEHDELYITDVGEVPQNDHKRLEKLGFIWDESDEVWKSFRFGSG